MLERCLDSNTIYVAYVPIGEESFMGEAEIPSRKKHSVVTISDMLHRFDWRTSYEA
jgi:hypothetical protein